MFAVLAVLAWACAACSAGGAADRDEPYRPQFHFTPERNWMNDPNGLIYHDGKYHLFFQHNPSGATWGNISWGHAVSTDLVHWKELPVAIPQDDEEYVYSGSVVYDRTNSSGLGTASSPPLVAVYTSHLKRGGAERQSLAYSTDAGTTWRKYAGNPVLDVGSTNFRDPKVFWHAATKAWVMVVALSEQHKVAIYTSPDLKRWTHTSEFGPAGAVPGGVWECPDLFALPADGDPARTTWVMVINSKTGDLGAQYFTGSFDGRRFVADDKPYTPPSGDLVAGFENGYQGWSTTGTAFGTAPASGTLPDQQPVTGYDGAHLANSFAGGDAATGTLTSTPFTLRRPYLNLLVGGGRHPRVAGTQPSEVEPAGTSFADFEGDALPSGWTGTGGLAGLRPTVSGLSGQQGRRVLDTFAGADTATGLVRSPEFTIGSPWLDFRLGGGNHPHGAAGETSVNLVVDGAVVRTATGKDAADLDWVSWNLADLQGRRAHVEIVDDSDGSSGWGHLIADDFVFADPSAAPIDRQTAVNLLVDGQVVRSVTGANTETLDNASWDVAAYKGRTAQIQVVDRNTAGWGHILLDRVEQADAAALTSTQRTRWVDYGADYYATASYDTAPGGKRIMIGWMNNWDYAEHIPTSPWRSAQAFPRELSLRTVDGRLRLVSTPVSLTSLHDGAAVRGGARSLAAGSTAVPVTGSSLDLTLDLRPGTASSSGVDVLRNGSAFTRIGYDRAKQEVFVDRSRSGDASFDPDFTTRQSVRVPAASGRLTLRVLVDRSSVEVFVNGGAYTLTDQVFPPPGATGIALYASGPGAATGGWSVQRLRSAAS